MACLSIKDLNNCIDYCKQMLLKAFYKDEIRHYETVIKYAQFQIDLLTNDWSIDDINKVEYLAFYSQNKYIMRGKTLKTG